MKLEDYVNCKQMLNNLSKEIASTKDGVSNLLSEEDVSCSVISKIEAVMDDLQDYVEGAIYDPLTTVIIELCDINNEVHAKIDKAIEILEE